MIRQPGETRKQMDRKKTDNRGYPVKFQQTIQGCFRGIDLHWRAERHVFQSTRW